MSRLVLSLVKQWSTKMEFHNPKFFIF